MYVGKYHHRNSTMVELHRLFWDTKYHTIHLSSYCLSENTENKVTQMNFIIFHYRCCWSCLCKHLNRVSIGSVKQCVYIGFLSWPFKKKKVCAHLEPIGPICSRCALYVEHINLLTNRWIASMYGPDFQKHSQSGPDFQKLGCQIPKKRT